MWCPLWKRKRTQTPCASSVRIHLWAPCAFSSQCPTVSGFVWAGSWPVRATWRNCQWQFYGRNRKPELPDHLHPLLLAAVLRLTFLSKVYLRVVQVVGTDVTHSPDLRPYRSGLDGMWTWNRYLPRKPTNVSLVQTNGDCVYNAWHFSANIEIVVEIYRIVAMGPKIK